MGGISIVSNCLQFVVPPLLPPLPVEVPVVPERSDDDDNENDRQNGAERRREVEDDAEVVVAEVDDDDVDEQPDERREATDEEQVRHDDAGHPTEHRTTSFRGRRPSWRPILKKMLTKIMSRTRFRLL